MLQCTGVPLTDPRTGRVTPRLSLAPFANDNRASPTAIRLPASIIATVCAATAESGEPAHAGVAAARSIWYRFIAFPATGLAMPHPPGVRVAVYLSGTDTAIPPEPCPVGYAAPCDAFTVSRGTYELAIDADPSVTTRFTVQLATYAVPSDVRIVTPHDSLRLWTGLGERTQDVSGHVPVARVTPCAGAASIEVSELREHASCFSRRLYRCFAESISQ